MEQVNVATMSFVVASLLSLLSFPSSSCSASSQLHLTLPLKIIKSQALSTITTNPVSNKKCSSDLTSLVSGSFNSELWALQMLDASGKINPGLLSGNLHVYGDYEQCLSMSREVDGRTIDGQYCTLIVILKNDILRFLNVSSEEKNLLDDVDLMQHSRPLHLAKNISLLWGVCVPKSCSAEHLQDLARHVEHRFNLPVETVVIDQLCSYKGKSVDVTQVDLYIYCFFIIVLLIMVSSTMYDSYLRYSGQDSNCFVVFSAYTNVEKLFSYSSESVNDLCCLNGIKVLSCCWIMFAHITHAIATVSKNPVDVATKWKYYNSGIFVWSAFYGVGNFFTISGCLVSFLYLKYSERMSINLLSFYMGRFIRLSPALLAMTFVHMSILKLLTNGPRGAFVVELFQSNYCPNSWWSVFSFFHNFSTYKEFAPHTWYLSIDSQLYLWAPLILFHINKYPRTVLIGMTLAFLTGIIYSLIVTITKGLGVTRFEWSRDFWDYLYLSSFYHLPSWLIGIVLGYIIYQNKIKISKNLNLFLWIVSIYVMLRLIFGQIVFLTEEYNVYRAALWNGFSKPLWSLALAFFIFSCATGNGGFMNTFLCHPVFRVLGKLTYSMNLIHIGVYTVIFGNKMESHYFGYFQTLTEFGLIFSITLVCSLLLYLGFEAPFMALKYQVEKKNNRKQDTKKNS